MTGSKPNSVLIVDDDTSNLMILSNMLRNEYNVSVASGGRSAVRIAEKHLPDLILLDVIMPDMDGYQVFETLQAMDRTAHIPIIFLTGLNSIEDEKRGLRLGAVDYISKPFDEMIVKLRVHHQICITNQLRTIEQLSMIDQLTGVPNRRNFDSRLRTEWSRSIREKFPITLLVIDADNFKDYNDTHGHLQGDRALRTISDLLTQGLKRGSDFAARWGGEEFIVLLPNTGSDGGLDLAERIRESIQGAQIPCEANNMTRITVSIGLATHVPDQESSIDELISRADKALYRAKRSGKNRVCAYG